MFSGVYLIANCFDLMTDHLYNIPSEETPPKAGAMINTFRAFGYNLQTAIADIIDNSISARAENVWIQYEWAGEKSWVTITDDGDGMDRNELIEAMTPGSKDPKDDREEHDLGRFGLGLKTSSFSQCKALTVLSKKENHRIIKRHWDLDYVNETGKWNLLDYLSQTSFQEPLEKLKNGTIVLWEKMDRLVGNANIHNEAARIVFLEEFEKVEEHLSLVFHRYMERNKLTIWMNGKKLDPWDPFMKESEGGQLTAHEILDSKQVIVKCYVLPHISKLSPENEQFKNARILVDIPNKLDHDWKIDIKKATATPSIAVRKDLVRLGKMTRKMAGSVHRFRGNQIMLDDSITSFDFQPVWKAKKGRDDVRHYFINEDHAVIKSLLEKEFLSPSEFKSALKLIGATTPVEAIIQYQSEEPESHELRDNKTEPDSGTIELARMMYSSLKSSGMNRELAIKQIFNIEPFNQYTQLIEYFD